jgi:hypothetical protein
MFIFAPEVYEAWLLAPFEGLVTPAVLQVIRGLVGRRTAYTSRPEDFVAGSFPFEAYDVPESLRAPAIAEDRTHA